MRLAPKATSSRIRRLIRALPPGYSEQAFQQIQIGMTKEEVFRRLGPPLNNVNDFVWSYTEDNAFAVWDFAWLMREIVFDEHGRVKVKRAEVAYD